MATPLSRDREAGPALVMQAQRGGLITAAELELVVHQPPSALVLRPEDFQHEVVT